MALKVLNMCQTLAIQNLTANKKYDQKTGCHLEPENTHNLGEECLFDGWMSNGWAARDE